MPARDYLRLSIQGSLPGGEVWSVNPAFRDGNAPDIPTLEVAKAWARAVATAISGNNSIITQQLTQLMSQACTIDNIRVTGYHLGKTLYYGDAALANPYAGSGAPTGSATQALAVSLRTENYTRSGRGRFYWPALRYPIDVGTTRFTRSALPGTLSEFRVMLTSIAALAPAAMDPQLIVTSRAGDSGGDVTEIRLGDVVDTQRRRRDALVEYYASAAFPG